MPPRPVGAASILAGLSVALSLTSLALTAVLLYRQGKYNALEGLQELKDEDAVTADVDDELKEGGQEEILRDCRTSSANRASPKAAQAPSTIDIDNNVTSSANSAMDTTNDNDSDSSSSNRRIRPTLEHHMASNGGALMVQPIGVVRSIYRLCVGTPRQGLLAPHARGRIELSGDQHVAQDAICGLEEYSHIWIVFLFHLNLLPNATNTTSTNGGHNKTPAAFKVPAKIAPPALGGTKVGVLATRSPHRFNPIGITLVKLDLIEIVPKHDQRAITGSGSRVRLHISGLDLVDGTPVLDIKPFVPTYDSVVAAVAGAASLQQHTSGAKGSSHDQNNSGHHQNNHNTVQVPPWVSNGLATRRSVTISEQARQELKTILIPANVDSSLPKRSCPLEFYGQGDESPQEALDNILQCIQEVLAMDVRSSWQTNKARDGKFKATRANRLQTPPPPPRQKQTQPEQRPEKNSVSPPPNSTNTTTCTQQLDNLLIHYTVTGPAQVHRSTSEGSGAEDHVCVTSVQELTWPKEK